jgi:hypothetical protein
MDILELGSGIGLVNIVLRQVSAVFLNASFGASSPHFAAMRPSLTFRPGLDAGHFLLTRPDPTRPVLDPTRPDPRPTLRQQEQRDQRTSEQLLVSASRRDAARTGTEQVIMLAIVSFIPVI